MYSSTNSILKKLLIHQIIKETDEAVSLILLPLDGWQPIYKAGQFITLYFETDYGEKRRSYSISSSSAMNEPLQITIKKIDNGHFSRQLVYQAKVGDILLSTGISGFFVLPKNADEFDSICFLAAGSGITPCMALIKDTLVLHKHRIILFFSNRTEADTIFLKELEMLQQQNTHRLQIKFLYSNRNNVMESRMSHWLLSQLLQQYFLAHSKSLFFVCGPWRYMQMANISLLSNGIGQTQIIKEDFNPLPKLIIPTPPDTDVHEVTIFINNTIYTFNVQYPLSISSAAKQKGIILPYSCEAGRCGSCAATCTKGKIWMAYNEVLVDEEVTNGRILCCQAFPVGGNATIQF